MQDEDEWVRATGIAVGPLDGRLHLEAVADAFGPVRPVVLAYLERGECVQLSLDAACWKPA